MAFVAGAIVGNLLLNTSGFTGGIAGAVAAATSAGPGISGPILAALSAIEEAGTRVAHVIADVVSQSGHEFDNMGEAAERAGVSVEFLSTMGLVAKDAGSSVEGLGEAMKFLNRNTAEALDGSEEAVKAFAKVGISVDDLRGAKPEDVFFKFVDGFNQLDSAAAKTNVSMQLLGRGGSESIAFLNMGTEQMRLFYNELKELGGGVSAEQAKMGDAFARTELRVQAAWHGIRSELATPLLSLFGVNEGDLSKTILNVTKTIHTGIDQVSGQLKTLQPVLDDFRNAVGPLLKKAAEDTWNEFRGALPLVTSLTRGLVGVMQELTTQTLAAGQAAKFFHDSSGLGFLERHTAFAEPLIEGSFGASGELHNLRTWADRRDAEARGVSVGKGL
jgi:hypothetical protein